MTYLTDPRVDAYINALPDWQQAICREVRELVHSVDPEVIETIKRVNRPYFVLQGNICALLAAIVPSAKTVPITLFSSTDINMVRTSPRSGNI